MPAPKAAKLPTFKQAVAARAEELVRETGVDQATAKIQAEQWLEQDAPAPGRPQYRTTARKPTTPKATTAETLRETLAASVELAAAQVPASPGLDSDAGLPAEQVGEVVKPAKDKAPKAPAATSDKGEALLALLTRPEGATVRQSLAATGWSHSAVKRHVTNVIRKQLGYRIECQRAPKEAVDPRDRAYTMFVYRAVKA